MKKPVLVAKKVGTTEAELDALCEKHNILPSDPDPDNDPPDDIEGEEVVSLQLKVNEIAKHNLKVLAAKSRMTLNDYCVALFECAVDEQTSFSIKVTKNSK